MIKITFPDISLCVHLLRRLMFTSIRKEIVSCQFHILHSLSLCPKESTELQSCWVFLIHTHDFHIFKQLFMYCRTLPEPICSYTPIHPAFWVVIALRGVRASLFCREDLCSVLWGFEVFCAAPYAFSPAFLQSVINGSEIDLSVEGYRCWQDRRELHKLELFNSQWSQNLLKKPVISFVTAAVGSHKLYPSFNGSEGIPFPVSQMDIMATSLRSLLTHINKSRRDEDGFICIVSFILKNSSCCSLLKYLTALKLNYLFSQKYLAKTLTDFWRELTHISACYS